MEMRVLLSRRQSPEWDLGLHVQSRLSTQGATSRLQTQQIHGADGYSLFLYLLACQKCHVFLHRNT